MKVFRWLRSVFAKGNADDVDVVLPNGGSLAVFGVGRAESFDGSLRLFGRNGKQLAAFAPGEWIDAKVPASVELFV